MASPVVSAIDAIATLWAALTPPTKALPAYKRVEGRVKRTGTTGDRCFYFAGPAVASIDAELGASATHKRWRFEGRFALSQAGRSNKAMVTAIANETALLMRAIDKKASWPSGVLEVQTLSSSVEQEPGEDALISIEIEALCAEED